MASAAQQNDLKNAADRVKRHNADLQKIEKQLYELETTYLQKSGGHNVLRGFSGFHK
jgi:hypothetical protein